MFVYLYILGKRVPQKCGSAGGCGNENNWCDGRRWCNTSINECVCTGEKKLPDQYSGRHGSIVMNAPIKAKLNIVKDVTNVRPL